MHALIVGAEPALQHELRGRGVGVTVAGTAAEATAAIGVGGFSAVVLDLVQPDGPGLDVIDALRESGSAAHVIVVGARLSELDRVDALQRGADDVVVKPFSVRELTERVVAVQRRQDLPRATRFRLGRCDIDLHARRLTCDGRAIELTAKEFDLLAYLSARPGQVFSREQLLNAVWHSASEWQQPATVTEHVRRLRNKIELDPCAPTMLVTVRRAGYRLDLPDPSGPARPAMTEVPAVARLAPQGRLPELDAVEVARIAQGIADDEFVVHYQPVVDLADGHVLLFEALIRWEHPGRGTLLPSEFLDVTERSGLIVPLGELVLEKACRQAAQWRRSGADIGLSVNVSARQLTDPCLADRFADILRSSGFDPAHLWLEITETSLTEDLHDAADALQALVALGVGVSIDDFGTGWACLTYLHRFPVHTLKIDASFVAGLGGGRTEAAIVRSILGLAAELELFAVAEGIETAEQHEELRALGCTIGQGYFFGRPVPASEVLTTTVHRIADAGVPARRGAAPRARPVEQLQTTADADLLRGLLRAGSARAAVDLLQQAIRRLGGTIVPVRAASRDAFPVDVALGEGPPMLVDVAPFSMDRLHLERVLGQMVEDARHAVGLLRRAERVGDELTCDDEGVA